MNLKIGDIMIKDTINYNIDRDNNQYRIKIFHNGNIIDTYYCDDIKLMHLKVSKKVVISTYVITDEYRKYYDNIGCYMKLINQHNTTDNYISCNYVLNSTIAENL